MDILERIIENMTSDEVRRFKILSNRFKADEEKKVLILFDAIRAGNFKAVEEDLVTQLYGSTDAKAKNTYYRLRNKLMTNLEKSLLFYHFNYKNAIESLSNIQLAMLYQERGLYREAYYSLKKAEKVAVELDQFQVLEVVYDEMVKLAVHHDVDIGQVIERRRANQEKIDFLRSRSEVLGMVTQELMRRNFSRSNRSSSVIETLEKIQTELEEHTPMFHSASGKIMVLRTVVSILIQKSAWAELASYCERTYQQFEDAGIFSADNHPTRLMLRIWRINALHKLLRLEEAAEVIDTLERELLLYKKQNYQEYAFHYYSSRIFNLKYQGQLEEADAVLQTALRAAEIHHHEVYEVYLLISLADQYFSQHLFPQALDAIHRIVAHPGYLQLDEELRLYIHVFELVNLHEARQYQAAEKTFKSMRKKYRKLLKDDFYDKTNRFLDILMRLNTAAVEGKRVFLKAAYDHFVETYEPAEIGGNQIILFDLYLQSKLEEECSYYELLTQEANRRSQA